MGSNPTGIITLKMGFIRICCDWDVLCETDTSPGDYNEKTLSMPGGQVDNEEDVSNLGVYAATRCSVTVPKSSVGKVKNTSISLYI